MALRFSNAVRKSSQIYRQSKYIEYLPVGSTYPQRRTIMSSLSRMEKALEHLKTNPYFEKYAKNIAKLQETSPEDFLSRVEQREKSTQQKKEKREMERKFQQKCNAKPIGEATMNSEKSLNDIMKLDLIVDKGKEEIVEIWLNYHQKKDCISGVLDSKQFDKIFETAKKHTTFLLPLPRDNGYEFIVCQFHGTEIHMTPLIWYQTHKENAPECLTIVHYLDLKTSKDIVLMRGEFDSTSMNAQEAQCLANEIQLYYSTDDPARLKLLKTFTERPDEFKHMDLVAQLETISLNSLVKSSKNRDFGVSKRCGFHLRGTTWSRVRVKRYENFSRSILARSYSQYESPRNNPFYVTTPIFYVNAGPHIGHLYSALLADSMTRYHAMLGYDAILATGTDEHGNKVANAAEANKLPVQDYCRTISSQFKNMCDQFDIGYTHFARTTDEKHHKAVQHFWNILRKREQIYLGKYSGWYCVPDETFVPNSELGEKKMSSGETIKVSAESGHPVEWTEEENYKFKLSGYQNDLKHWLKNVDAVRPAIYHKILSDWIEEGSCLEDLSVSRPVKRAPWGISVPDDHSHTIYVWLDALVNYLTSMGYPNQEFPNKCWPPSIQVIGKDILKFHGVYWPAFLIAAGLEPPKTLICHAHWTVEDEKMSKSKGNVISPFQVADELTHDGLRYFLLREAVPQNDANYSSTKILRILNAELADTFGNLVSRCMGKSVNPMGEINDPALHLDTLKSDPSQRLMELLECLSDDTKRSYDEVNLHHVVDSVMQTLHAANRMVEHHKPWQLRKESSGGIEKSTIELEAVLSLALETCRISALVLMPIVPKLCSNLLDYFQVPIDERLWKNTKISSIVSRSRKVEIGASAIVFRRIKT